MSGKKKLHGNEAKIDPKKKIESMYATNAVTATSGGGKEPPSADAENAVFSRDFSRENKK